MKNYSLSNLTSYLKNPKTLAIAFFVLLTPIYLSAQVMQGILETANSWLPTVLPVVVYLFTNFIKSRIKTDLKAVNWIIFAVTAFILTAAWGYTGFPTLSFTEVLGSSTAIWGIVTTIRTFFIEKTLI